MTDPHRKAKLPTGWKIIPGGVRRGASHQLRQLMKLDTSLVRMTTRLFEASQCATNTGLGDYMGLLLLYHRSELQRAILRVRRYMKKHHQGELQRVKKLTHLEVGMQETRDDIRAFLRIFRSMRD